MDRLSQIKTKRIGVLMGGPSREREISIKSGTAVYRALRTKGLDVVSIELQPSSTMDGYAERVKEIVLASNIGVAFVALHGAFGEDGTLQGLLESIHIPYTGSGALASRVGMDKIRSKVVFESHNIPAPRYSVLSKTGLDNIEARVYFNKLGYPLVVKPCSEGSSIGVSIVDSKIQLLQAIDKVFEFCDRAIVEEYIHGREITVGILEDKALPLIEIIPGARFFNFEAKYQQGMTEYRIPASVEKHVESRCQEVALAAHRALGAKFFSRVDMILNSNNNTPLVLEVNTIPGLTETSLLPKAARAAGVDFGELVLKILESALW